ncbi:MAG: PEP/pyruvate-binding domain-containing protein [Desulfobacterota bacterium]|nr:PEP/pyruvate-binding domain-containing protein [Thermodesulfobacteriota bacterium]
MGKFVERVSSGLESLDHMVDGLRSGDNVVLQVDNIDDIRFFVAPFVHRALSDHRKVVYMRFARHRPLIENEPGVTTHVLDAYSGFETFSTQAYNLISKEGENVFYVFDSLSDLLSAWATDLMIGNFFRIACPYLYQLNTVAYFAILRNSHSFKTVARIRETTQVLIDVHNVDGHIYVHPLKVKSRHSPTMFLPHAMQDGGFIPITSSVDTGRLFSNISRRDTEETSRNLDYWDRLFLSVEDLLSTSGGREEKRQLLKHLCEVIIGREQRILDLAVKHFTLEDFLDIKTRFIGSGYIGGKAAGMLLARKILSRDTSLDWNEWLEPHDSFYIGSDVFYTYIVENDWWKLRMEQKTREGYFPVAQVLREYMLEGAFPEEVEEQFWRMIEYFGQSPIIIRSSSLLEDAFGNAFAGKYESIFSVNQGSPEQRFVQFREYVRRVYSSMMNEDALTYRLQRGLDHLDEQMALLVQRVSGSYRGDYFFPDMAGVGISYNTFAWRKDMDARAGMIRIVLGLGTRAVNRVDNDYPRIVALDAPLVKPYSGIGDARKYSQHEADVLDIPRNSLETIPANLALSAGMKASLDLMGYPDRDSNDMTWEKDPGGQERWILTFDGVLSESPLTEVMQRMLKALEKVYDYPVDIEFTVNFTGEDSFAVNLVQCRPLQTKGEGKQVSLPDNIPERDLLFRTDGTFMGSSTMQPIRRIVSVDPEGYHRLALTEKYDIARLIGKINRQIVDREQLPTLLIGPGRWGTTTPSLGVPVRFAEINNMCLMVELGHMGGGLMPELSFGTHFFQDLVETDIFYVALFPDAEQSYLNRELLIEGTNLLKDLLPEQRKYENVVMVKDLGKDRYYLCADVVAQRVLCYRGTSEDS